MSIHLAGILDGCLDLKACSTERNSHVVSSNAEGRLSNGSGLYGQRSRLLNNLLFIFNLSGNIQLTSGQSLRRNLEVSIANLTGSYELNSALQSRLAIAQRSRNIRSVGSTIVLYSNGDSARSIGEVNSTLNALNSKLGNRSLDNDVEVASSHNVATCSPSLHLIGACLVEIIKLDSYVLVGTSLQTPNIPRLSNWCSALLQLHINPISLGITSVLHVHHNLYLLVGGQHLNLLSGNSEGRSGSNLARDNRQRLGHLSGVSILIACSVQSSYERNFLTNFKTLSWQRERNASLTLDNSLRFTNLCTVHRQCDGSVLYVEVAVVGKSYQSGVYSTFLQADFRDTTDVNQSNVYNWLDVSSCYGNVDVAASLTIGGQSLNIVESTCGSIWVCNSKGQFLLAINFQRVSCQSVSKRLCTLNQLHLSGASCGTNILNFYLNCEVCFANLGRNVLSSQFKLSSRNRSSLNSQRSLQLGTLAFVVCNNSFHSQFTSSQTLRSNSNIAEALLSCPCRYSGSTKCLLASHQRNRSIRDVYITLVLNDNTYITALIGQIDSTVNSSNDQIFSLYDRSLFESNVNSVQVLVVNIEIIGLCAGFELFFSNGKQHLCLCISGYCLKNRGSQHVRKALSQLNFHFICSHVIGFLQRSNNIIALSIVRNSNCRS